MTDLTALALNAVQSLSVAEIHGVVCGLAVWQPDSFELQELTDLVGVDALTDEFSVEAFVNASVEALRAEDMSFAPLLPDDDVELEQRLDAVADWCAGFLAGFGAAGMAREMSSLEVLPEEIQEIVGDLSAITDIDVDGIAGAQDDAEYGDADQDSIEEDLVQIHEFVKVGVLLIFSTINMPQDEAPGEFDG